MVFSLPQARRLSLNIDRIRSEYERNLTSKDNLQLQMATAMWIIDRLALRVGNEKEEDEADTVGCCSLRVEHLKFPADNHVEMDFLGKDSMRYHQTIGVCALQHVCVRMWVATSVPPMSCLLLAHQISPCTTESVCRSGRT